MVPASPARRQIHHVQAHAEVKKARNNYQQAVEGALRAGEERAALLFIRQTERFRPGEAHS